MRRGLILAALAGVLAPCARAADWSATADVQLATRAERNPALRANDTATALALSADLASRVSRSTETLQLQLVPSLHVVRNPQFPTLDREEQQLGALVTQQGERYALSASAQAARESTLTTELGTTGLTDANRIRQLLQAGVQPTWRLTERLSVSGGANLQDIAYPGTRDSTLYGSRYTSVSANSTVALTRQAGFTFAASVGQFVSDRQGASSENTSVTGQLVYSVAERLTASLSAGPSWVRATGHTDNGYVYQARLNRQAERSTLSLLAGRAIAPSGYGLLTQQDTVQLSLSRQLTERIIATCAVSRLQTSDLLPGTGLTFGDVRYLRADLSLGGRLARNWGASLTLGAGQQTLGATNRSTQSFEGRLAINWSGEVHVN